MMAYAVWSELPRCWRGSVPLFDRNMHNLDDLAVIEKIIGEINTIKIDLDVFTTGKDLLNTRRLEGDFDIYLLEIQLPDTNGLEVAKAIRKHEMNSIIIFTAAYVFEAYEYILFNYLLKPVSKDTLTNTLLRICKRITTYFNAHLIKCLIVLLLKIYSIFIKMAGKPISTQIVVSKNVICG